MKHLIALDLDGTTLNKKGDITPKTKQVIDRLKEQGHIIVLATGRPLSGAYQKYLDLELTTPIITDNGGSIENPKDHTFPKQKNYIPLEMMHTIFKFCQPFIITAFFSIDEMTYAYQYDPKLEAFFSGINAEKVVEGPHTDFIHEATGLVYIIRHDAMETFESYVKDHYGNILSTRLWGVEDGQAVYEIYLKHISKSSGIQRVLDFYQMNLTDVIAFGDGVNDVEMIRDAHHGVAMLNAVDEVKKVCKTITAHDHDHDGVANYLIDYFNLSM